MMGTYLNVLSDNLNYIIGFYGYTLDKMSERCGISRRKLCQIVNREKSGMDFRTLIRISENLHIPLETLLFGKVEVRHEKTN